MADPLPLPGGLLLRECRPDDVAQVGALLAERGEPEDAEDHRLVVTDPDEGLSSCAVVVDGDRVVSTATLLAETVRVGDVVLPAGQVELVATDRAYEGRGLVRALMAWAHDRSAARGDLLQVMVGIPYLYRLFGYEYAIDIPRARPLALAPAGAGALRRAGPEDAGVIADLQAAAQAGADVAMPHPAARLRWLLTHEASTTWVLGDGEPVASARVQEREDELLVAETTARDEADADRLLHGLLGLAGGRAVRVVDRPWAATGRAWTDRLGAGPESAEQYYVRVADPVVLLDALRPVLDRRLATAPALEVPELVLSTYDRSYRLAVTDDGLGPVRTAGRLPWPGAEGGAAFPPDLWAALLLGPLGITGLDRLYADVVPGPQAEALAALFPPLTADLLTYYLPW
ncbi:GNAT family N-acetyltransferase [Candidatus Blastococcus massiliensis]|uniref:GNAT family N-acetyltransferase n=1 Tax=Candidatus Blastococcus massiliensis TaxID=1470358 RepID=UPI0004ACB308|nr:GNAT family N-acetyltransferase [Candidatus Blastococcus massiliensis]